MPQLYLGGTSHLRRLSLSTITGGNALEAFADAPVLESVHLSHGSVRIECLHINGGSAAMKWPALQKLSLEQCDFKVAL